MSEATPEIPDASPAAGSASAWGDSDAAQLASAAWWLDVIDEDTGERRRHALLGERVVIGRSSKAGLTLASPRVSREHAELVHDPFGRWWVRDLSSRNGTQVNDAAAGDNPLRAGDRITVGPFRLTLHERDEEQTAPGSGAAVGTGVTQIAMEDTIEAAISRLDEAEPARIDTTHLAALHELATRLDQTAELGERLRSLCRMMVRHDFRGRAATVLRVDLRRPDHPPLMLCEPQTAGTGFVAGGGELPYVSRTLLRAVKATRSPALAGSRAIEAGAVELSIAPDGPGNAGAMAAAAAPLVVTDSTMDVLYVVLPPELGKAEWLALVALAAQRFVQSEQMRTVRRAAERAAAIDRELARAREIQMRLVPRKPAIAGLEVAVGFEPCKWVGGDYVDVCEEQSGRAVLVTADVTGKGLPAALVAGELHAMVHAALAAGADVVSMMRLLNAHLCRYLEDGMFATMVAVALDTATGKMTAVNAGHPPPVVIAPDGAVRTLPRGANPPLGVLDEPLTAADDVLEPGSMLALFTDGLTEMRRADGVMLGEAGLAGELAGVYRAGASATIDALRDAVTAMLDGVQAGRMPDDDRTFLVARLTGK